MAEFSQFEIGFHLPYRTRARSIAKGDCNRISFPVSLCTVHFQIEVFEARRPNYIGDSQLRSQIAQAKQTIVT